MGGVSHVNVFGNEPHISNSSGFMIHFNANQFKQISLAWPCCDLLLKNQLISEQNNDKKKATPPRSCLADSVKYASNILISPTFPSHINLSLLSFFNYQYVDRLR